MPEHHSAFGSRRILLLSVAVIVTFAVPLGFSPAHAKSVQAQSQPVALNPSDFKFEVASIKPNKADGEAFGYKDIPNGISLTHFSLQMLIKDAFGIYEDYRYSGAPGWINSDRYDIEARVDNPTA